MASKLQGYVDKYSQTRLFAVINIKNLTGVSHFIFYYQQVDSNVSRFPQHNSLEAVGLREFLNAKKEISEEITVDLNII